MSSGASKKQAIQLLKDSTWFQNGSDSLLETLAVSMIPVDATDGHVFVEEGEEMHHVMILEEGGLVRTKLSLEEGQEVNQFKASLRDMSAADKQALRNSTSVTIDEISGRGRITGMLHNIQEGARAYATVSAKGPAKVWLLPGEAFREAVSETPQHALDMLASMARELRVGTKSLRGLIQKLRTNRSSADDEKEGKNTKVCRVICYDATSWTTDGFMPAVQAFNEQHKKDGYTIEMDYTTERLGTKSATYAAGYDAVCLFVNDTADAGVLQTLSLLGVKMIAMRCAGFDRVDTKAARAYGMTVARVPAYSPYAVAEMAIALLMAVNRKITQASARVKMANFSLDSGLMGMDIYNKTVGVMGTGKIGQILCNIVQGFGAKLLCYDVYENDEIKANGGVYVSQDEIFSRCNIIFLMMPLLPATHHTINDKVLSKLKKGVLLINTSRGGLIDTKALLKGLKSGIIRGVGMDVYENEQDYFFQDWSARQVQDEDLVALLGNNNVVLTAHQAFFTQEAVDKIVSTTMDNVYNFLMGKTGQAHPNNCIPPPPQSSSK